MLGSETVDCLWESRTSQLIPDEVRFDPAVLGGGGGPHPLLLCLVVRVRVEEAGRTENKIKLRSIYVY